jgi:hypothetical protein
METKGLLFNSQQPVSDLYPEPDESSLHPPTPFVFKSLSNIGSSN